MPFCWIYKIDKVTPSLRLGMLQSDIKVKGMGSSHTNIMLCQCHKKLSLSSLNTNWFLDDIVKKLDPRIGIKAKRHGLGHGSIILGEGLLEQNNATLKPENASMLGARKASH